jgi:hypothetical protein
MTTTDIRARLLALGSIAEAATQFARYRMDTLPDTTGAADHDYIENLIQQGFEEGWRRAIQAADALLRETGK